MQPFDKASVKLDQVYSNTRVPTQVNTNQRESTRVNTNQHESDTSQHESTRVRHESLQINICPTRVNTSHLNQETI